MALDSTVAGAQANSYLSVADANALATDDLGSEAIAWLEATHEQREKALKRATREIDGYLRSGWARYSAAQALLFPRAIDYAGTPIAPLIPRNVELACYEQATYVLKNATVIDNAHTRRARDMHSASEPNISYTERPDADTPAISDAALLYLEGYRRAGGSRRIRSVLMTSGYAL